MKKFLTLALGALAFAACAPEGPGTDDPQPKVPSITEVRNDAGDVITSAQRGTGVQIMGENLGGITSVKFNGDEADMATALVTDEVILVTIPVDAPTSGSNKIEISGSDGSDETPFTVIAQAEVEPEPVITGVKNSSGAIITTAERGEVITVAGQNLAKTNDAAFLVSVSINGAAITKSSITATPESLTFTIPATTPTSGSNKIVVTTLGGSTSTNFVVTAPVVSVDSAITGVENAAGETVEYGYKGTVIKIVGTKLAQASSLIINDKTFTLPDAAVTVTDTSVSFTIPADTKTPHDGAAVVSQLKLTVDGTALTTPFYVMPYAPVVISNLKFEAQNNMWTDIPMEVRPGFKVGDDPYVDRPTNANNKISKISDIAYEGTVLIATSVDGRNYKDAGVFFSFNIDREAEVIVMFSFGGMRSIPAWLLADKGWEVDDPSVWAMGDGGSEPDRAMFGTVNSNASAPERYYAFRKTFPAGSKVELFRNGENKGAGEIIARSPYFVLVK